MIGAFAAKKPVSQAEAIRRATDKSVRARNLYAEQTVATLTAMLAGAEDEVSRGIDEFAAAQLLFYRDLTPEGIDKLATRVFTIVDTDALDFMTNYNLVLAGDVHRELADGIKRTVMNGIAAGKGVEDIARDLGRVVKDPESFRHAGSKVFNKAPIWNKRCRQTGRNRFWVEKRRKQGVPQRMAGRGVEI